LYIHQAAASLAAFSLDSPAKPAKNSFKVIDDERLSHSPKSIGEEEEHEEPPSSEEQLSLLKKKFVGEIELPESGYLAYLVTPCIDAPQRKNRFSRSLVVVLYSFQFNITRFVAFFVLYITLINEMG
jgi:hypothetical protein